MRRQAIAMATALLLTGTAGMAMAEARLAAEFNREGYPVVDNYTYVLSGDGCLMEGVASEAASLAGHLGLGKLILFYDRNEITIEGKRYFKSLIHDAKDAQRELNYWRSMAAETVALAPKAPFIGPVGAFNTDIQKWATANDAAHAFIEYDGPIAPQRQG